LLQEYSAEQSSKFNIEIDQTTLFDAQANGRFDDLDYYRQGIQNLQHKIGISE